MTMNAGSVFGDGRDYSRRRRIDEADIAVTLIHDEKHLSICAREEKCRTKPRHECSWKYKSSHRPKGITLRRYCAPALVDDAFSLGLG